LSSLRLNLGLAPDAPIDLQVTNQIPVVLIDTAVAVREAMKNSSQTRDLDLQELQQKRRVNEAQRNTALGTTISAGVGFNQSAQTFNDSYHSPLQSQNFSVSVEMPVLQWGGRKAQIEAAKADQERVSTDARLARGQRELDARYAALGLAQAARQLEIAAKADSVGAKRFEVARNRYTIGRIDISNLFIAQGEKDQALEAYVDALRGYWDAFYRLRRLTLYDFVKNEPIR
jgi:outer membrane protein TolC